MFGLHKGEFNPFSTARMTAAIIAATALLHGCSLGGSAVGTKIAPDQRAKVIVVGAGISGLTAALDLTEKGIDVIVLEKESHVGGRLESVVFDGVAANLGVQWVIPGLSPLVDSYLTNIPLQWLGGKDGGMALTWEGKFINVKGSNLLDALPLSERARKDFAASLQKMRRDAAALYPGIDFENQKSWDHIFNLPMDTPLWKKLETMSIADYLAEFDPAVLKLWGTRVTAGFGGTPETVSALFLVGWYHGNPFFPISILKGGNHRLAEEMAADARRRGARIFLGTEVNRILQKDGTVFVECADGRAYASDYCVVTVPATVAKKIICGLSREKSEALGAVSYSYLATVALHVRNFPDEEKLSAVLFMEGRTAAISNQTGPVVGHPREGTILLCCITDPKNASKSDTEIMELVYEDIRMVVPGFDPKRDVIASRIRQWPAGEVHVSPGFLSQYGRTLREPAGHIYFGGEFVSTFPTWGGAVWG